MQLDLRVVRAHDILELRARMLRPGLPLDRARYNEDDEPGTLHVGAYQQAVLVGCATLMVEEGPMRPGVHALRLRGMAVDGQCHRQGIGRELLTFAVAHATHAHPTHQLVWFNARHSARDFYQSMGFERWGEDFDLPPIGMHTIMWKLVTGHP